jgi:hypothetical protein
MNPDYADGFTFKSTTIDEGLPAYLSQIFLVWRHNTGYEVKFYAWPKTTMSYKGRRPPGYFGDVPITQITPEMIVPRFPRVLKRFRGAWLAEILKSEVGTKARIGVNEEAKAVWSELSEEVRSGLINQASAVAGPEGYLRDPHALALLIKGMMDHGVPIKNPILIGEVLKEIAGRRL